MRKNKYKLRPDERLNTKRIHFKNTRKKGWHRHKVVCVGLLSSFVISIAERKWTMFSLTDYPRWNIKIIRNSLKSINEQLLLLLNFCSVLSD